MFTPTFFFGDTVLWTLGDNSKIKCRVFSGDKRVAGGIDFATLIDIETLEDCPERGIKKGENFVGVGRESLSIL